MQSTITIKPNNHRIYQCPQDKKIELLVKTIKENNNEKIMVIASQLNEELLKAVAEYDVKVIEDKELVKAKDLSCEFLISYDMPIKAIVYMARLAHATKKAVMLLDKSEQNDLHSIETLLGRAIKQDKIDGFGYAEVEQKDKKTFNDRKSKSNKDPRWEKKRKAPNKYLGKDENGKAIFSGKSGDRNHRYDGTPRDKWDAPKKVGKTIKIKSRTEKKD